MKLNNLQTSLFVPLQYKNSKPDWDQYLLDCNPINEQIKTPKQLYSFLSENSDNLTQFKSIDKVKFDNLYSALIDKIYGKFYVESKQKSVSEVIIDLHEEFEYLSDQEKKLRILSEALTYRLSPVILEKQYLIKYGDNNHLQTSQEAKAAINLFGEFKKYRKKKRVLDENSTIKILLEISIKYGVSQNAIKAKYVELFNKQNNDINFTLKEGKESSTPYTKTSARLITIHSALVENCYHCGVSEEYVIKNATFDILNKIQQGLDWFEVSLLMAQNLARNEQSFNSSTFKDIFTKLIQSLWRAGMIPKPELNDCAWLDNAVATIQQAPEESELCTLAQQYAQINGNETQAEEFAQNVLQTHMWEQKSLAEDVVNFGDGPNDVDPIWYSNVSWARDFIRRTVKTNTPKTSHEAVKLLNIMMSGLRKAIINELEDYYDGEEEQEEQEEIFKDFLKQFQKITGQDVKSYMTDTMGVIKVPVASIFKEAVYSIDSFKQTKKSTMDQMIDHILEQIDKNCKIGNFKTVSEILYYGNNVVKEQVLARKLNWNEFCDAFNDRIDSSGARGLCNYVVHRMTQIKPDVKIMKEDVVPFGGNPKVKKKFTTPATVKTLNPAMKRPKEMDHKAETNKLKTPMMDKHFEKYSKWAKEYFDNELSLGNIKSEKDETEVHSFITDRMFLDFDLDDKPDQFVYYARRFEETFQELFGQTFYEYAWQKIQDYKREHGLKEDVVPMPKIDNSDLIGVEVYYYGFRKEIDQKIRDIFGNEEGHSDYSMMDNKRDFYYWVPKEVFLKIIRPQLKRLHNVEYHIEPRKQAVGEDVVNFPGNTKPVEKQRSSAIVKPIQGSNEKALTDMVIWARELIDNTKFKNKDVYNNILKRVENAAIARLTDPTKFKAAFVKKWGEDFLTSLNNAYTWDQKWNNKENVNESLMEGFTYSTAKACRNDLKRWFSKYIDSSDVLMHSNFDSYDGENNIALRMTIHDTKQSVLEKLAAVLKKKLEKKNWKNLGANVYKQGKTVIRIIPEIYKAYRTGPHKNKECLTLGIEIIGPKKKKDQLPLPSPSAS